MNKTQTKTKHYFLINPIAGNGEKQKKLDSLIAAATCKTGLECSVYYTKGAGDTTRYIKEVCEKNREDSLRFYVCGGDGTFHEGINGTTPYPNAICGIVPVGTGNDFVKNFTNTGNFLDMEAQLKGRAMSVDALRYNGGFCGNMINIGFDCAVASKIGDIKRNPVIPNKLAYGMGVLETLVRMPGVSAEITIDGEPVKDADYLLCTVANGSYCGGGYYSNPHASVEDGIIDAVFIGRVSRMKFINLVGMYKKGTYLLHKDAKSFITYIKCKSIRFDFGKPTDICVDGEIEKLEYLEVRTLPKAVGIICPEGCELKNKYPQRETVPVMA